MVVTNGHSGLYPTDCYDRLIVRDVTQAIYVFVRMPVIFGITLLIHLTPARRTPIK